MTTNVKTNSRNFVTGREEMLRLPWTYKIRAAIHSLRKPFFACDDFNWDLYNIHYRAEIEWNNRYYTEDISTIDYTFINGMMYILADCKPVHFTPRCIYETFYNLPRVSSIGEVGVGGGRFTANLQNLLARDNVQFSAYDLSEKQLQFFKEQYPSAYAKTEVGVLDLTTATLPEAKRVDTVLASTVLMHIQRSTEYQHALHNLLNIGRRFVVIMDHWNAHDYYNDLVKLGFGDKLFTYDSGSNIAIIISVQGETLDRRFSALRQGAILGKYVADYRF